MKLEVNPKSQGACKFSALSRTIKLAQSLSAHTMKSESAYLPQCNGEVELTTWSLVVTLVFRAKIWCVTGITAAGLGYRDLSESKLFI